MVQKVFGKVQEGPRSPPDPLTNYLLSRKIFICLNIFLLLPIELPIGLPIEFGLALAWGAKGPGPDRLGFGLGGQGSWAGPAWLWLGGPRVLGRAGLAFIFLPRYCIYFSPRYCNYFPPSYCNYFSPSYCNYFSPSYCIFFV